MVLFVLAEVFAVLQAIHASGKRSRNNSVRPSAYFQSSPKAAVSGLSLPHPLKMLEFELVSLSLCERVGTVIPASPHCSQLWLRITLCSVGFWHVGFLLIFFCLFL